MQGEVEANLYSLLVSELVQWTDSFLPAVYKTKAQLF